MVNYVTPSMYGAVGDNSTDDTAALQAMFDAFGQVSTGIRYTPGIVQLAPGTIYKTSDSLNIHQCNIWVDGQGAGIRNTSGNAAIAINPNNNVNPIVDVSISNLAIQSGGDGIHAMAAPQLKIDNCRFKDMSSDGTTVNGVAGIPITLEGCVSYAITNNQIDKCGSLGIYVKTLNITWTTPNVIAESQSGVIENNRIARTGSIAILCSEGGAHSIIRNDIEACYSGVEIRSCYDYTIEDNYFEANTLDIATRNLVDLVSSRHILGGRIIGNQCESIYGVYLYGGANQIVAFNRLSGGNVIASGVTGTMWADQVAQGSYSNSGTGTVTSL